MTSRILITGGAGFIGSHLADAFLKAGRRVRVLDSLDPQVHGPDRRRPAYLSPDVELLVGDVRDREIVRRALEDVEAVYHFAAKVGVGQSMYAMAEYTSVNSFGTSVLLEAAVEKKVRRIVVASSMSVYGEGSYVDANGQAIDGVQRDVEQLKRGDWEVRGPGGERVVPVATPETKRLALESIYALTKYDQERACLMIGRAYGIEAVALRVFNTYGTRQALSNPSKGVLASFASRLRNGNRPLVFEDSHQQRDFVGVHDVVRACVLALDSRAAARHVVNVGSGRPRTVREVAERIASAVGKPKLLPEITGSCRVGDVRHCFADIAKARRLLGHEPRVDFDESLSRRHVEKNVSWVRQTHGNVDLVVGDVRDADAVRAAMRDVSHVVHVAAQVAVTTSLIDPLHDFDVNARGTLVVLEAMRAMKKPPSLLYTSTNKVYGACNDAPFVRQGKRCVPEDERLRDHGIDETRPLEFHSPYGCAKGIADQYVLDGARTYGLRTCAFRMSCIYGSRQFGNEDQGWVAHIFVRGEPIAVYGDGHQVRDVLFVDDLVDATLRARAAMPAVAGRAFNVDGGPDNALSLLELLARIEGRLGRRPEVSFEPWRTADQWWYVSDVRELERELGWRPRTSVDDGLDRLRAWVAASGLASPRDGATAPEAAQ